MERVFYDNIEEVTTREQRMQQCVSYGSCLFI